jgi:hypothetical protein
MDMRDPEVTANGTRQEVFSVVYAKARRLIPEHNDLEGATRCLSAVLPASEASLWK